MNRDDSSHNNGSGADKRLEPASNVGRLELGSSEVGLPVILNDGLVPLTEDGRYVPNHLDASGMVHWFSIVNASDGADPEGKPYQMRYFRAARGSQGEILYDSYPIMPLTRADWSPAPLPNLELLLEDGELAAAQTLASDTAERSGLSPLDLTQLRPLSELASGIANSSAPIEQFRSEFAQSAYHLLEPIHPSVNYSFEVMAVDPWTEELTADKWWFGETERIEHESVTLATYSVDWPEFEKALEHERALLDRDGLHRTYQEQGLEAAMQRAEAIGLTYGELDPNRADGRLFHSGPTDQFTTRRENELGALSQQRVTDQELHAVPTATIGASSILGGAESWDEMFQLPDSDPPEIDRHYWQLWVRPVMSPDGTSIGHALFCTEFPELPPNFDQYLGEYGMDDTIYPTQARTVEMADFRTEAEAREFGDEFRKHLIPGLIDGPELAPDVARLEGLSGAWTEINYDDIVRYMSSGDPVIWDKADWHVHRPYGELDAETFAETHHTSTTEIEANRLASNDDFDMSLPAPEL